MKLTRTEHGVTMAPETEYEREIMTAIVKAMRSSGVTVKESDRPHVRHWPPGADQVDLLIEFSKHPWDPWDR